MLRCRRCPLPETLRGTIRALTYRNDDMGYTMAQSEEKLVLAYAITIHKRRGASSRPWSCRC